MSPALYLIAAGLFVASGFASYILFRKWIREETGKHKLSQKLFLIAGFAAIYVPILMLDILKLSLKIAVALVA